MSYNLLIDVLNTLLLFLISIILTPLLLVAWLSNEFELTLGVSLNDTHPILMSSNNLFLKALQVSIPCLGLPAWYSQVNSGLYQMGNGGCSGSAWIRAMCPMLSSLVYNSFKGMGSGDSCYEVYFVFSLWWLFWLFDWLFVRLGEKGMITFMWEN
jgi:hypothetical protein